MYSEWTGLYVYVPIAGGFWVSQNASGRGATLRHPREAVRWEASADHSVSGVASRHLRSVCPMMVELNDGVNRAASGATTLSDASRDQGGANPRRQEAPSPAA
jgi:X-X-X-Leu-X-X-Gly heptad repeat protein